MSESADILTAAGWPKTPEQFLLRFPDGLQVRFAREGYFGFPILSAYNGAFEITIGCQDRSLDRWLRYGLEVADNYEVSENSTAIYTEQVKAIATALGIAIPEKAGRGAIDGEDEEAWGEDEEDEWEDEDDDDWDDDEEDEEDWDDEEEDEEELADAE